MELGNDWTHYFCGFTMFMTDTHYFLLQVNYVNCHATSTLLGDVAEMNALKKVWTTDAMRAEMKINGTKSMIGHSLGGAGGLEAIATVKAITTGWLHPTLNQNNLDPAVVFDTVPKFN